MKLSNYIKPERDKGVPLCMHECQFYDGKRCRAMGFRSDRICEPAVIEMHREIKELKRKAAEYDRLVSSVSGDAE